VCFGTEVQTFSRNLSRSHSDLQFEDVDTNLPNFTTTNLRRL